ncbi:MAG: carbohydrate ABC transporter permease [Lachnospiraceae bacterium]|nr:carbohydrate ABC transporter permease [Lachnospiraceae bacterium]
MEKQINDSETVVLSRREKRKERRIRNAKKRHFAKKLVLTFIAAAFAISFLLPTILTMANSFMSSAEISSNYGVIFNKYKQLDYGEKDTDYVAEKVNLKLIPDMVDFSQYSTVLLKSPQYLLKFWNSVILVIPIMILQILVALGAAYSFMRFRSKRREVLFFMYVAVMLMPFQVTLVPNYIVADWLHILDTRWSIILPGIFAPFSVYLLTKFMRRIPDSLIEAAQLDGADEWQIFTKVCVPLCKGPIASVAILVFIDYWNMVEQPLIMLSDGDMHPLSVFLSKINTGEVGLAFAVATIYMVPTILIFLYGEEYLVDGISYSGSVKG